MRRPAGGLSGQGVAPRGHGMKALRRLNYLAAAALLCAAAGAHAASSIREDLTAISIEDPQLLEGVRATILRPIVSGLARAQRPLEMALDEAIYRVMTLKYKGKIHDASPQMDGILKELAGAAGDRPSYPWKLLYIDDPSLNVFSTAHGRIYVFAGILDLGLTEADLAGILGHEMAHTVLHHMARRFEFAVGAAAAGAAVSAVLQSQLGAPAQALMPLGFWMQFLAALKMNRDEETAADELAMTMLHRSPFGCGALPRVLEKLAQRGSGASDGVLWKYLQTHPPASDRIARAARRCAGHPAD